MKEKRFTLIYDLDMWTDKSVTEEFDTVDELLTRYKEIEYDYYDFEAWDGDKKIYLH